MKYFFGLYYFLGQTGPYKRNADTPRPPGAFLECEISKERYRLSLDYLEEITKKSEMKSL